MQGPEHCVPPNHQKPRCCVVPLAAGILPAGGSGGDGGNRRRRERNRRRMRQVTR